MSDTAETSLYCKVWPPPPLLQRLFSIQATEEDLGDYNPHLYADEGDSDTISELERISIPDDHLNLRELQDLGPKFRELADICRPPRAQNWM